MGLHNVIKNKQTNRNVAILGSLLFTDVGYVVFPSGKTQALLEQCVLEGGGIEVKFKQKRVKNQDCNSVFKSFCFPVQSQFCMFTCFLNNFIVKK